MGAKKDRDFSDNVDELGIDAFGECRRQCSSRGGLIAFDPNFDQLVGVQGPAGFCDK